MSNTKTKLSFEIDVDLAQKFKDTCKKRRLIQSGILRDLIDDWLEKQKEE